MPARTKRLRPLLPELPLGDKSVLAVVVRVTNSAQPSGAGARLELNALVDELRWQAQPFGVPVAVAGR